MVHLNFFFKKKMLRLGGVAWMSPHQRDFKAGADLSILRGNAALTEIRKSFTKKILDSIEVSFKSGELGWRAAWGSRSVCHLLKFCASEKSQ